MELETKNGLVKIYAKTLEETAKTQIIEMANAPIGENANIRIMPDAHAGAGCVIGTTMKITNKICPNLVGVDIGCGVDLVKTNLDFDSLEMQQALDKVIREKIPYGKEIASDRREFPFHELRCWDKLKKQVKDNAYYSLGTLGGGNHFIEAYRNGYLSVHSGSRNIGYKVAEYYQNLAIKRCFEEKIANRKIEIKNIPPRVREKFLKDNRIEFSKDLAYLTDQDMEDYLYDIKIIQKFAVKNRTLILETIVKALGGVIESTITSTHNYIDTDNMILRKGAISAKEGELLVIPLNMKDGLLICKGKGNEDWNYSAPHGAGRLYSRTEAKKVIKLDDFKKAMEGIYSTCINENTLDESPFAYKDWQEIVGCIQPTVDIQERIIPIYNFKAEG